MNGNSYGCDLATGEENEFSSGGCKWNADLKVEAIIKASFKSSTRAVDREDAMSSNAGETKVAVRVISEWHDEVIVGCKCGWVLVEGEGAS